MEPALTRHVVRSLEQVVLDRMASEPVIILQGPRAVGKSTLLQDVAARHGARIVDLDDLATRDAVRADPTRFLDGDGPVFIDEFQHAPEILDAIKARLNIDSGPGRFVITGSTRYAMLPAAAQALTGRAHRIDVRPLSQGEIAEEREDFASALLDDPRSLVSGAQTQADRADYVRRVVTGGFPLALRRSTPNDRARWFDDYLGLIIERDVLELSRVRQRRLLPLLIAQLAGQSAQVLNTSRVAAAIGLDRSTAENYVKLLDAVFLISPLPAWGTTLRSRVAATPKVHLTDTGLAARLLRLTEPKLLAPSATALSEFGHLLETFAVNEVHKQLDRIEEPVARGHWRTHDGDEIDLIIERSDGKIVALEVKAGSRVPGEAFGAMVRLRDRLGDTFLGGVVLYTGSRGYEFDDRVSVVPLDRLWRSSVTRA